MTISREDRPKRGSADRRKDDRIIRDRLRRYKKAFHVSQDITSEMDRDLLFEVIILQTKEVME